MVPRQNHHLWWWFQAGAASGGTDDGEWSGIQPWAAETEATTLAQRKLDGWKKPWKAEILEAEWLLKLMKPNGRLDITETALGFLPEGREVTMARSQTMAFRWVAQSALALGANFWHI